MQIKRGDVIDIDFDPARGHEIRKTRPAVVVQRSVWR
jgi:mRNA interferase MazF